MTMSKLDLTLIRETLINERVTPAADIQDEQDKMQHHIEENPDRFDLADKRLHQENIMDDGTLTENRSVILDAQIALEQLRAADDSLFLVAGRHPGSVHLALQREQRR
jgi:hypothetical protein